MLFFDRERGQTAVIDHGGARVVVKVLWARRDGEVRLGFSAPPDVSINRGEVQDRIDAERGGKTP
jgi:carbon storage regulator CsrA